MPATLDRPTRVSPPLKWHGGKWYLATKIVALMPSHTHYVEPFAGGLSVLLAKDPEGVSEVINDLNAELTIFWRVLQNEDLFGSFQRVIEATPFSESEYNRDKDLPWMPGSDSERAAVNVACRFFVRCRQSLAGRMNAFAPLSRVRTRRGMNEQASAWLNAVEGLPAVHARLKRVAVLNRDALNVIRQQDGPDTLQYLDPPYLAETRAVADVYAHEMTAENHVELLDTIRQCRGKVMLSGYGSKLYLDRLSNWNRKEFRLPNQASGEKEKRTMTEVLWTNF